MKPTSLNSIAVFLLLFGLSLQPAAARERWTAERAQAWGKAMPWLVGCNYIPATAINQLEMWQADTFDPARIDRELGWAESLGFNSVRVFLHHLLWEQDSAGLLKRMDQFLSIADRHKIGVMFVLFDSCWDPAPKLGKQRLPRPGLHNSGWVQSPGIADLKNPERRSLLEAYVKGVVGRFKNDRRVQVWDVFNEPDNRNDSSYGPKEPPDKVERSLELLRQVFAWARAAEPAQPLTSGVWHGTWGEPKQLVPTERVQLDESDVISFHDYSRLGTLQERVRNLQRLGRPLLCTEYMARPAGSRFDPSLRYLKEQKIGAYNWGFVAGKSQTIYPWDSWKKPLDREPDVWFHDIFRADGTPFDPGEVATIRRVTGKQTEPADLATLLLRATVKINHPKSTATGFILSRPDRRDPQRRQLILVTAAHVFDSIPDHEAVVDFRGLEGEGAYRKVPVKVAIRTEGKPRWLRHPAQDIAVLAIDPPADADLPMLPMDLLATDRELRQHQVHPGDELALLGYPHRVAANAAGFAILRSGPLASFPIVPSRLNPTFLLSANSFEGDSGGPVFLSAPARQPAPARLILGLVTGQHFLDEEMKMVYGTTRLRHRLGLAIVVQAAFIRETIERLP